MAGDFDRLAATRLIYVAAETGARFVRERTDLEPVEWLLSPLRLFDGAAAIEACRTAEGFRRAVVLHGLSLGLDASPTHLEGIPAADFLSGVAVSHLGVPPPGCTDEPQSWGEKPASLYTCSISAELDQVQVQIFCAMMARSAAEVRSRLRRRYGPLLEDEAQVRLGFDWSEPLACAMVSEAVAHTLMLVAEDPASPLAAGLDFQVEQRFAC